MTLLVTCTSLRTAFVVSTFLLLTMTDIAVSSSASAYTTHCAAKQRQLARHAPYSCLLDKELCHNRRLRPT